MVLVLLALVHLAAAALLGLLLVLVPGLDSASPLAMTYGALALVGFLGQMVVAVQQRLLPLAAWLWAYAGADYARMPPSLHTAPGRLLPALTFAGWAIGAPLLAVALALDRPACSGWRPCCCSGYASSWCRARTHAPALRNAV